MEIKQEYRPPLEVKPKTTFFSFVVGIFAFLLIPLKFTRDKFQLLKEDTASRHRFLAWRKRENTRYRRGIKLNDEF